MLTADLAGPDDEAELRRLMAANAMTGRISLTFEREPDYFAATKGATAHVIVIRDKASGSIASFGEITTRNLHVNGTLARVGYLSSWRVDRAWRGRPEMFDMGIERLAALQAELKADVFYSSILEDNLPARKRLEVRRGLGTFEPIDRLETSLFAVTRLQPSGLESAGEKASALRSEQLPRYQFSPSAVAPGARDWQMDGACAAVWDQRRTRQTVIRGYERKLALVRPAYNLWARLTGRPALPPVGSVLPVGVISGLAVRGDDPATATRLLDALRGAPARELGLGLLALTLSRRHPLARAVAPLSPYRWGSQLYVVTIPGCLRARDLDPDRPAQPEAGFL